MTLQVLGHTRAWGQRWAPPHRPLPAPHAPTDELTVCAGAALPAIPADAGERVSAAHAGAPVHAGVGQAAAVLGCEGGREESLLIRPWAGAGRGLASGQDGAGGRGGPSEPGAPPPHRWCRCRPSSLGGRRSGRCPRCHSTCRRCCKCRHRTGTRLWAHRPLSGRAHGAAQTPARQGRGGHSREWQVLPFQPSSQAQ